MQHKVELSIKYMSNSLRQLNRDMKEKVFDEHDDYKMWWES